MSFREYNMCTKNTLKSIFEDYSVEVLGVI